MPTPQKSQAIDDLRDRIDRATAVLITEYRGLKAQDMHKLRRALREAGLEYKVVKNTLLRRAAAGTYAERAANDVSGPIGVVFAYGEAAAAAKLITEKAKELDKLNLKWGTIAGSYFVAEQIAEIAKLPGRQEMLGQVVATIHSPVTNLVSTLHSIPQRLLGVLQAYAEQQAGSASV